MPLKIAKIFFPITMLLAIGLIVSTTALAQSAGATTANLEGSVLDEAGASISGAKVSTKQVETNLIREITADENGFYQFTLLPPGNYDVNVTADGFKAATAHLSLLLGTTNRVDFMLKVGETSDIVEVSADSVTSEGKTESSTNVDTEKIEVLPINRRDFLDFATTAARVTPDRVPAQGATATSGLSFNGQSARFNNITIDGLTNNDLASGNVRATFSQEAVQEFQIISDGYTAEFGRTLSGVINIVTRGGGNQYHGNLFLFNRNDEIAARDAFASFKPPFSQYQFGAIASGPVKKDRLFFFTSFERLSIAQNSIVTISDQSVQSGRRQGFVLDNGPRPFAVDNSTYFLRLDARLSSSDSLYFRYNYGGTYNGAFKPFSGLTAETTGSIQRLTENTFAFNNTYVSAALNLVNETRFLYGRRTQGITGLDNGPGVSVVAPEGQIFFGNQFSAQPRQERIYQIVDNVSLTRGRHNFKFGVDYNYTSLPDGTTSAPFIDLGNATFNPIDFSALSGIPNLPILSSPQAFDPTLRTPAQIAFLKLLSGILPTLTPGFPAGVPLADIGLPLVYIQGFGGSKTLNVPTSFFATFAQDDFRLRQNLLIKAGVRYDINRVRFAPDNNGNISPRLAFSYVPKKLPKLTVHGAYGLFFAAPLSGTAFFAQQSQSGTLNIAVIPFPFSVLAYAQPGHHFPLSDTVPSSINFEPQLTNTLQNQPDLKNSYSQQASFGLDYLIANNTVLSLSYNYVRGLKLFATREINPVVRPVPGNLLASLRTGRVIPSKGQIDEFEGAFDSYFNGLTLGINRRFSKNFGFLATYTFSKTIDNTFDIRTDVVDKPQFPLSPGEERSLSIQDVRSRFVFSGIWSLNYTKNPFLRDFQVSTIITLTSGRPYNLLAGQDLNMDGDNGDGDRPLENGVPIGRNAGITPGLANMDLRITRTITFKERFRFQGFIEAFNIFNRTNISELSRTYPPDAQGNFHLPRKDGGRFIATPDHFVNAFPPRQFQIGFRLSF